MKTLIAYEDEHLRLNYASTQAAEKLSHGRPDDLGFAQKVSELTPRLRFAGRLSPSARGRRERSERGGRLCRLDLPWSSRIGQS
jgi:hypothetical protein